MRILLSSGQKAATRVHGTLEKIRNQWPDTPFSAKEASKLLDVSYRTIHRALDEAREKGEVEAIGGGPKVKYFFKKVA